MQKISFQMVFSTRNETTYISDFLRLHLFLLYFFSPLLDAIPIY